MQTCSLQHRTLFASPVLPTPGYCFHFGSVSSFFLELFLNSSPIAYWAPTDLGSSYFSVIFFLSFHTVHGVLKAIITCQQIWKTQQWPQDWKWSFFILISKKGNAKECSNYHKIEIISHVSKVMLKILQARLQQDMNCELKVFKLDSEKAEKPEIKLATSIGLLKK